VLLKELSSSELVRMDKLVRSQDIKDLQRIINQIFNDLLGEGFEHNEIEEYLTLKINKFFKTNI